jgi:hypothetical protein
MKTPAEIHEEVGWNLFHHSVDETTHRAFTVADIEKIIKEAKAEVKGVCEWKKHHTFVDYKDTGCGNQFYHDSFTGFTFCPGCGKEIKLA